MNKQKQIDILRKKNDRLSKQLDDIRSKLEHSSELNSNEYKRAKDLICDLEKIKQDWTNAINELNIKKEKYSCLINDLQEMKKIMANRGFKIPWYKKIINKIKRL